MARSDSGYLPHENPCAQCGKPISAPDWIENGPRRISYLWYCRACDYWFEAVAFYDASNRAEKHSPPDGRRSANGMRIINR